MSHEKYYFRMKAGKCSQKFNNHQHGSSISTVSLTISGVQRGANGPMALGIQGRGHQKSEIAKMEMR